MQCAMTRAEDGNLVKELVDGGRAQVWLHVYRILHRRAGWQVSHESMPYSGPTLRMDVCSYGIAALMRALRPALIGSELGELASCTRTPPGDRGSNGHRRRDSCGVSAWAICGGGAPYAETDPVFQTWSTFGNACVLRSMNGCGSRMAEAHGTDQARGRDGGRVRPDYPDPEAVGLPPRRQV